MPADILLLGWHKGKDVSVDVIIVSPTSLDDYPLSIQKARRKLKDAESSKKASQLATCEAQGWGHHPAAYSPWGGQGPSAKAFMEEVMRRATADLEGWPKMKKIMELREGLSVTLARQVASQLSIRCRVLEALEQ